MANDISSANWRLDTTPFSYAFPVKINNINWTEQISPGDEVILNDTNGKLVAKSKAQQANFQQNFGKLDWQRGLTLNKIDSGVLVIQVGAGK
jgi:hypothetical protein